MGNIKERLMAKRLAVQPTIPPIATQEKAKPRGKPKAANKPSDARKKRGA